MDTLYQNDDLLHLVNGTHYIHDSTITRFDIYLNQEVLCIDIYFKSVEKLLRVHFFDVNKYGFYHDEKHIFYNVERYNFFKTVSGYYISLDPALEMAEISENDNDFVLCKNVTGNFLQQT